mgnify:CR=1 FL=1
MSAAVSWAPKEPLVMQTIRVAPPKKGEVRVKILYTSLCHTDVTFWMDKVIHFTILYLIHDVQMILIRPICQ